MLMNWTTADRERIGAARVIVYTISSMSIAGIESARLKLEHASQHLDALRKIADDFAAAGHFRLSVEWEGQHPNFLCRIIVATAAPIPDLIALQAADVISNLRSALDHAVFTHVIEHCATNRIPLTEKQQKDVYFPISYSNNKNRDWFSGAVLGVIDQYRPQQEMQVEHPLFQLEKLVNHDKHRLVLTTCSVTPEHDVTYDDRLELVHHNGDEPVEPGTELRPGTELVRMQFRAAPKLTDPRSSLRITGGFHLSIDIPGTNKHYPILPTLTVIRDYAVQIVDALAAAGVA